MPNIQNPKILLYFLPLLLVLGWGVIESFSRPIGDFGNYYFSSLLFSKGQFNTSVYDPIWFNQVVENLGFKNFFGYFSPFPPANTLLLFPFLIFEPAVAKPIFLLLISVLISGFVFRWFRFFEIPFWVALLIPIILYKPIQSNLIQGQIYFLMVVLLLEGFIAFQKKQIWLCSLLWGLAILLKIYPLILLLMFFEKSRRRDLATFITGFTLLLGLFILIQGWEIWVYFFNHVLPGAASGEVVDRFSHHHQSWNSLFSILFLKEEVCNPDPVFSSVPFFVVSLAVLKSVILGCCISHSSDQKDPFSAFSVLILGAILLLSTGPSYSLVQGLIFIILFFRTKTEFPYSKSNQMMAMGIFFLVCNFPFQQQNWPLIFQFSRLFLLGFIFVFSLSKTIVNLKTIGLIVLLSLSQIWAIGKKNSAIDPSLSFPVPVKNGLLVSFAVENNALVFTFRDHSGIHNLISDFQVQSASSEKVRLIENSIFLDGVAVLKTPDKKKNPMLINGNTLVYLSDKNQGFGFYSLRLLHLSNESLVK